MTLFTVLLLAFLLGCVCGLRTMMGPAVVCWGAHLGWLALAGSPLGFLSHPISLVLFTLGAAGELVGDKLPKTPARTQAFPFGARVVSGALCGASLAIAGHAGPVLGLTAGIFGAVAGTLGGYHLRRSLTAGGRLPDLPVAIVEDLIAVGGGLFLVSRF
jgi:uncharacterized membrane protein